MVQRDPCREEIISLHEFFVSWYTGRAEPSEFERLEAALGGDFELVTPSGKRRSRAAVLQGVDETYDAYAPGAFDIEIRNVELRQTVGEHARLRYEEWQDTPEGQTGRISTVCLSSDPAAPAGLCWRDLHETPIEAAVETD